MKTYNDWRLEYEFFNISYDKLRQPGVLRILPPMKGMEKEHYYKNVVLPKKIDCPICDYYKHVGKK